MIYDSLKNFADYAGIAPAAWKAVAEFLRTATPDMAGGCHELGNGVRALVQKYHPHAADADKLEIHRNFADIQLLLAGKESILCRPVDGLEVTLPYDGGKDIAFYRAAEGNSVTVTLEPGKFAVFFPEEGHMPGLSCAGAGREVVKVVVKIAVTEF